MFIRIKECQCITRTQSVSPILRTASMTQRALASSVFLPLLVWNAPLLFSWKPHPIGQINNEPISHCIRFGRGVIQYLVLYPTFYSMGLQVVQKVLQYVFWKYSLLSWTVWQLQGNPIAWENSLKVFYKTSGTSCCPRLYVERVVEVTPITQTVPPVKSRVLPKTWDTRRYSVEGRRDKAEKREER